MLIFLNLSIKVNTVKPLYKKLFFVSTFVLLERFSYKEVFTFKIVFTKNYFRFQ